MNIIPSYFFISLIIGFFIIYILSPKPHIVVKYPTLDNAGTITYVDGNNVCYRYKKVQVDCPLDKRIIPDN